MCSCIKVQNIDKTFILSKKQQKLAKAKKLHALEDVSFEVKRGEIFGLLGPNGAGKTTLLRTMATLMKPDDGDIQIDGFSILQNTKEIRKRIGFLTSELKLDDVFTPNFLFDFYADLYGTTNKAERKKYLFEKFDMDKYAEVKMGNLSTGNRQKMSLIIALVNDPDVIIFDEPTNGLDILAAKIVTDFLLEQREKGKTIVISSHIFSLIEELCDRVAVMIDGEVVACDSLKSLCGDTNLSTVFFDMYEEKKGK